MAEAVARGAGEARGEGETRRDFLYLATGTVGAVGALAALWPLIDQMNPTADVLALASTDVDLAQVPVGQELTVMWRGRPVFVRHRSEQEIAKARADDTAALIDPETDQARVQRPEWLVVVGVCTHLGCVPLAYQGAFGGYFCPCHGSIYDTSGRVRKGPAPENLAVPQYSFLDDTIVRIG